MIYMDPLQLGCDALIKSWMDYELPSNLTWEQKDTIKASDLDNLKFDVVNCKFNLVGFLVCT